MTLKHTDLWRSIDALAARHGLSVSGLAQKAGLSPTIFNRSKRMTAKRKRWPSTESIAQILQATQTSLDDFVGLASASGSSRRNLPLLDFAKTVHKKNFDEAGHPVTQHWEETLFPSLNDPHAFVLEVSGKSMEPVYYEGDRLIIAPGTKPRRNDRVTIRTLKNEMLIGRLGRENARSVELIALNPVRAMRMLLVRDIAWIYPIVWASQSQ